MFHCHVLQHEDAGRWASSSSSNQRTSPGGPRKEKPAMFRSILLAIDESEAANSALSEAIDLARGEGARLTLISVAASPRILTTGPHIPPVPTEDELVRHAEKVLARAEPLVPEDVPVATVIRRGPCGRGDPGADRTRRA
jgi:nucleotide-binding universal stress UspA family protein